MPDNDPKPETVTVTSYNQSGGITAHTVNIHKPPQRVMGDELKHHLLHDPKIPPGSQIYVFITGSGLEPSIFGAEIDKFLNANGYHSQIGHNVKMPGPPTPFAVLYDKIVKIVVGDNG